jgi:hypothetical protein
MNAHGKNNFKPWDRSEFEVINEREFNLLKRYHDETCPLAKNKED